MEIRPAIAADQGDIDALDCSYETEVTWQMEHQLEGEALQTSFRPVALPRPIKGEPPRGAPVVPQEPPSGEYLVVAEEASRVVGYLRGEAETWRAVGWITHLAVAPEHRHRKVGRTLLEHAQRWALREGLHSLIAETQTKNYPAIRFLQRCGFTFCGYQEGLYAEKDITVYFSRAVSQSLSTP